MKLLYKLMHPCDFERVTLVGINENTDMFLYSRNMETPLNVFGDIIVIQDTVGNYREICTGIKIPCVKKYFDLDSRELEGVADIPDSPFRGNMTTATYNESIGQGVCSDEYIANYLYWNHCDAFKEKITSFIKKSKEIMKNQNRQDFKRLIRRVSNK